MHTYKVNKVLDIKVMGLNGNDQTACLVALAQLVAEGHSRGYRKRRNLTKAQKESIRTKKAKRFKNQLSPNALKILQKQEDD